MDNISYLNRIVNIDQSFSWLRMSFCDQLIENNYFIENLKNEKIRHILGFVFILVASTINIITAYFDGCKNYLILGIRIGGVIFDFLLLFLHLTAIKKEMKRLNSLLKLIRYISIYIVFFGNLYLATQEKIKNNSISEALFIFTYFLYIILANIFLLYFMDTQIVSMIIIIGVKLVPIYFYGNLVFPTKFLNSNYLYAPTILLYIMIFLQKFHYEKILRETFIEKFKNERMIDYFKKTINNLNIHFITIMKSDLLYFNKKFQIFCKKFFQEETELDYRKVIDILEKFTVISNKLLNKTDLDMEEKFSLINKIFNSGTNDIFESVGQYQFQNYEENRYFEIFIRKTAHNYDDTIVDILMYDVTNIKSFEKLIIESQYKQKILGKIAHEFKTPLITINSLLKSITYQSQITDILCKINHVKNLSDYTIFLVSDIIQYVSYSNDKLKALNEELDINEIVRFAFEVLQTLIECNESKKDYLVAKLIPDLRINSYLVFSDEIRLKQILLNLISNAVKFTNNGEISLKVSLNEASETVEIIISDTGRGINDEISSKILKEDTEIEIEKAFNKFGSGIGLSITKTLCNLLGYKISYIKRKKQGSKFIIKIPILKKIKKTEINELNISPLENRISLKNSNKELFDEKTITPIKSFYFSKINQIEYCNLNEQKNKFFIEKFNFNLIPNFYEEVKATIVIIDDNKYVRENTLSLIHSIFRDCNFHDYRIIEGVDGIDLLSILKKNQLINLKIRLVLIDENMDFLNGSEAISIVRNLSEKGKLSPIRIYSVTAFEDKDTKERIQLSKPDGILNKPCSKSNLIPIMRTIIN